jgi:non-canonical (house-cleaning) NTP pyrophosphatase
MKVVVGSASAIKLAALQKVYPYATVSGVEVVSAVPPQPVGRPQTEEGEHALLCATALDTHNLSS